MRTDNRQPDEPRPVRITRHFTRAAGSVLIETGRTVVLCTASVADEVPPWMDENEGRGWVTAEYGMLPGSTRPRKRRERGGVDGRTAEIQRFIGRSLRAVTDLSGLGSRTVSLDCDVLDADGGTRTAAVTGAFIALVDALTAIREELPDPQRLPLADSVAAVSVGWTADGPVIDLDYAEDSEAAVDMNVVMTGGGRFVEVQGTGEEATFSDEQLQAMLALARTGIARLTAAQRDALGGDWPFPPAA